MTTKHTPGPWNPLAGFNSPDFIIRAEHTVVATVKASAANAQLIAAAPDMLAALKLAQSVIVAECEDRGYADDDPSPLNQAALAISAAIARARGEA